MRRTIAHRHFRYEDAQSSARNVMVVSPGGVGGAVR